MHDLLYIQPDPDALLSSPRHPTWPASVDGHQAVPTRWSSTVYVAYAADASARMLYISSQHRAMSVACHLRGSQ